MGVTDFYLDSKTGKVLGKDGAATNYARIIDKNQYDDVVEKNGGSTNASATEQLQKGSNLITFDKNKIQTDLQYINSQTQLTRVENQMYIVLAVDRSKDIPSASVTSIIGKPGTNDKTIMDYYTSRDPQRAGVSYISATGNNINIFLGQVHGHPLTTDPQKMNIPGTSTFDKNSSNSAGIPVYSIDSYTGSPNANINRVLPDGTTQKAIGTVLGMFDFGTETLTFHTGNVK